MENHGECPTSRVTGGSYFDGGYIGTNVGTNNCVTFGGSGLWHFSGNTITSAGFSGSGGTGGSGGTIIIEGDITRIHAYNGTYITDSGATIDQTDTWKQENQSIVYAQAGYSLVDLRADTTDSNGYTTSVITSISSRTATDLITELGDSYRSINYSVYTTYGAMGIGSGAGCIEVSNGTLTIN